MGRFPGISSLAALVAAWLCTLPFSQSAIAQLGPHEVSEAFAHTVAVRVAVPPEQQALYAARLDQALKQAGIAALAPQYVVLVDRSPAIQLAFIFWRTPGESWEFIGAAPVSTGKPGRYDHFYTPTGVFPHTPDNLDFRAEGTKNSLGVRGYGRKGLRIFDLGWATSKRGWGGGGEGIMRLQMHATDPDLLEQRLGTPDSKGCIRISASLNHLVDHYGLLDAAYEEALAQGGHFWVLAADREPVATPGRYIVVVDSAEGKRPAWLQPAR